LIGLTVLALLVVLVVWAVTRITRPHSTAVPSITPPAPRNTAEDVLADRLARVEIDATEYRERLAALREG
jgi:putative membrane protein